MTRYLLLEYAGYLRQNLDQGVPTLNKSNGANKYRTARNAWRDQ